MYVCMYVEGHGVLCMQRNVLYSLFSMCVCSVYVEFHSLLFKPPSTSIDKSRVTSMASSNNENNFPVLCLSHRYDMIAYK